MFARWSDVRGRRPFVILGAYLMLAPTVTVLLHYLIGLSLYVYFAVQTVASVSPLLAVVTASFLDVAPDPEKATLQGRLQAFTALGGFVGVFTSTLVSPPVGTCHSGVRVVFAE